MRPDDLLFVERMAHNKARKAALETDVLTLERQLATSKVRISDEMIEAFGGKWHMRYAMEAINSEVVSEIVRRPCRAIDRWNRHLPVINALERALIHDGPTMGRFPSLTVSGARRGITFEILFHAFSNS